MKADQERVAKLLNDTVTLLCKNGLIYKSNLTVQGLLGITLDKSDVFLVHINETIGAPSSADAGQKQKQSLPPSLNVVDLTKIADVPVSVNSNQHPQALRYQNQVGSPVLGSSRKQRPQMINQAMLLQRNELFQQVQQRLRMNTAMMPQGMGPVPVPVPVPIVPVSAQSFQPRQQVQPRPVVQRQKPISVARRPGSQQQPPQCQGPITVDEDDVVIVGTGREESHSSPRRSQISGRMGRPLHSGRNFRVPSNESHPIVIPQDSGPFQDQAPMAMDVSFMPQRMPSMDSIPGMNPSRFGEPKNFLGEIVIEPTNSACLDISDVLELDRNPRRSEDARIDSDGLPPLPSPCRGFPEGRKVDESLGRGQDKITVYLDVADDGGQNDFKPCCSGTNTGLPQRNEQPKDDSRMGDDCRKSGEESLNLDSLGLHMLTEGDDEARLTPNSWQCKAPTCQAFYSESSQLASHYTLKHSQQLDLSVRDASEGEAVLVNPDNDDMVPMESGEMEGSGTCPYLGLDDAETGRAEVTPDHSKVRVEESEQVSYQECLDLKRSKDPLEMTETPPVNMLRKEREYFDRLADGLESRASHGSVDQSHLLRNVADDVEILHSGGSFLQSIPHVRASEDHLPPLLPDCSGHQLLPNAPSISTTMVFVEPAAGRCKTSAVPDHGRTHFVREDGPGFAESGNEEGPYSIAVVDDADNYTTNSMVETNVMQGGCEARSNPCLLDNNMDEG